MEKELLFRENAPYEKVQKHCGSDNLYFRLHFPRLIQGMDNVLSEQGYSIILKNTGNSRQKEAKCLEELFQKDIDGLIIEPSKSQLSCRHPGLYENLEKYQIPYIFIQGIYTEMKDKPHSYG